MVRGVALGLVLGVMAGVGVGRRAEPESPKISIRPEPVRMSASETPSPVLHEHETVQPPTVDSVDIEEAVARFRESIGTRDGDALAAALGQVCDPAVEAMALELTRSGVTRARLAGLDLLDRLDIENPETHAAIVDTLADQDPRIVAAALYALHRGLPNPSETRQVVAALAPLASHPDEEVRRRAVIALGEWGEASAVEAALSDPSAPVRAGAAFAAGRFGLNVAGLAARVADSDEDWTVREQAYLTLASRPTDEATYAILAAFKLQREAVGEAGR